MNGAVTATRGRRRSPQLSLLAAYLPRERRKLAVLGLLLFGGTLLQVVNPQVIRYYIDHATAGAAIRILVLAAVAYLAVAAVLQVVRTVATYVGENAAWSMTNELRADLTRHCVALDMSFHRGRTPGELIERVDGDVTALARFLSTALLLILSNLLLVVGVFVSLFITDWHIAIALLVYAAVAVWALFSIRDIATQAWSRVRQSAANLFSSVEERLASVEDIRSSRAEDYVLGRLDRLSGDLLEGQQRARFRSALIFVIMHGLYLLGYGGALAVGAYLFLRNRTSIGTVYLVIAYANAIYTPLNEVRIQVQDLQRANACAKRVAELFEVEQQIIDGPGADLGDGALAVEFDHVSFSYDATGREVLTDLSFALRPGAVLGILGRTGSGKTTIARLLSRVYDPTAGVVRLDHKDLRSARLDELRGRIGMVTQDVQIFHGTVRDNLTLFDRGITTEELHGALDRLGLSDWLRRLPEGLDTILESGARALSAGEAQLLAMCRVFLRDPGLVILDEASSRLDPATERLLDHALTSLLRNRTAVLIAHRLATLARADRIMILEDGRIIEYGARDELISDPGSRLSRLALHTLQERPT